MRVNARMHAARVIAQRQVLETLISPGFYLTLAAGLFLGYALVNGFIRAVDSSGFNYSLNPLYATIGRLLEGAFGKTFLDKLFAEGPFLFAFQVSFLPVFVFLAVSSVFRFGLEKNAGAIELLAYGPADGTAYFLASFAKDLLLTLLTILVILSYLALAAGLSNLLLGPTFLFSLLITFFLSLAVYAYGILVSTLTGNASSALALFFGILVFFVLILLGSFAIVGGYVRTLSSVVAWIVKWLSPFFYGSLCFQGVELRNPLTLAAGLVLLSALTGIVLYASHLALSIRGVRA
jgi:hypothetical protein